MGKSRSGRRVRWLVVALLTAIAGLVTGFAGASALSGSVSPASAGDAVVQAPSGCSTTWDAVAYWCFDDQVSPTDDGAGSHNATVVGAAFATSSLPPVPTSRAALVFDGSNDYAWTPDPNGAGNLDGFSQMTLAAWVKPDKVSGVHMIVSKYNHSVAVSYWLLLRGDEIEVFVAGSHGEFALTSTNVNVTAGQWTHVAGTWTGTKLRLYANGSLVGTQTVGAIDMNDSRVAVDIGRSMSNGGYFDGAIDEVYIFDRALTTAEVGNLAASIPPPLPVVSINSVSGSEASGQFLFTVSLDKPSRRVVTVDRGTLNGTAVAPGDYFAPSTHPITFHPGETSKTIPITVEDDTIDEVDETFKFVLTHPVNAVLGMAEGVGTILDDDRDRTAPIVTVPSNKTVEATGPLGRVVSFAASAIDPPHSSPPVACRPSSGSLFRLGRTTVECSATDASGNTGTSTFRVTVRDTTAPVVTAPTDVTVQATSAAGATVSYPSAGATDLVGVTSGPTCAPASGSVFPVGANTVTCTAADAAGNVGSDTFRITVSPLLEMSFRSVGQYDGWVLESSKASGVGGTLDSTATTCRVGDDAADRQYRSILHFDTSGLPDNAVIVGVTLRIKKQSVVGTNPLTTHGNLNVDAKTGSFRSNPVLENQDFSAAASGSAIGRFAQAATLGWHRAILKNTAYPLINLTGSTQFRVRFATDDNDDLGADYLSFYTGDAAEADRPQLIVTYSVP